MDYPKEGPNDNGPDETPIPESFELVELNEDTVSRFPIRSPIEDQLDFTAVPTITVEVEATCLHCGAKLGEYRKGTYATITHPPLPGETVSHVLTLDPENTSDTNENMAVLMGKWIRTIHTAETASPPPPPPTPEYTEIMPPPHVMETLNELIGPHIRAIAATMHLLDIIGPMQQMRLIATDVCGFSGSIILRVESEAQHGTGRETESVRDGTERQPTSFAEALEDYRRGRRNRSHDHHEGHGDSTSPPRGEDGSTE